MRMPLSRGTSILAALVFVGILGVVAWGVSALAPSAPPGSQSAEAAAPSAQPQMSPEVKNSVSDQCNNGEVHTVNETTGSSAAPKDATSKCYIPNPNAPGMMMRNPATSNDKTCASSKPNKCTVQYCPPAGIVKTAGSCIVIQCDAGNSDCLKEGLGTAMGSGAPAAKVADIFSSNNTDISTPNGFGTVNGSDRLSSILSNQGMQDVVKAEQANVDAAQQELDGLVRACGESPGDAACTQQLQQAQQDLADEKARQATLQQQMNDLSKSQGGIPSDGQPKLGNAPDPSQPYYIQRTDENGNLVWCDQNGNCKPSNTFTPPKGQSTERQITPGGGVPGGGTPGGGTPGPGTQSPGGNNGLLNSLMQGLMGGLAKGLMQAATSPSSGAACSSDPNAYAQQQQQYNMQMQQYQYQMQQYQMQQQYSQYYGYAPTPPPALTPPAPCQANANQNTCAAAPTQPDASGCPNGTYKPITTAMSNGYQCTSSWQCVPGGAGTPTAQISCQPQVADVGMSIAISYSCGGATGSAGSGFNTQNQLSGATTTVMSTPPQGATGAVFGINCTNAQGLSAQAQCNVQVGRTSIILVANPKVVHSGEAATIGWITTGMQSCVVSSPDLPDFTAANADNASPNGMATTSPLSAPAHVLLHCTTAAGGTRDATTTVSVYGIPDDSNGPVVTTYSSIDGQNVAHGDSATIGWSASGAPSGARMSLWLYDVRLGGTTAVIAMDLAASSTYNWTLPSANDTCDPSSNFICSSDLVAGRQYGIEADLYTGSTSTPNYIGDSGYSPEPFTISQ